ncbi:MAG TPA: hypothetical protein VGB82_21450 [Alphaproteobacteria bacterium]
MGGCDNLPLVKQVHQQCANAQDVKACEDAAYARAYAIERQRVIYSHTYW